MYWPVKIEARLQQQIEVVTKWFWNITPVVQADPGWAFGCSHRPSFILVEVHCDAGIVRTAYKQFACQKSNSCYSIQL